MQDVNAMIIYNDKMQGSFWRMRLETGWKSYDPGQFVMLEIPGPDTFLRRPFSICRLCEGVVEICYKVVGKGTAQMTEMKAGSKTSVLGPLGKGFRVPSSEFGVRNLLVAGGYGVAPLLGLAEKLSSAISLFYGAKTKDDLLYIDEFKKLGVELHIATEDGSMGEKGIVTDVLEKFLLTTDDRRLTTIYACGPHGMLNAVKRLHACTPARLHVQLSLESHMACGTGVCAGCVVMNAKGEYVRVCKEGPVFDAEVLKCLSA